MHSVKCTCIIIGIRTSYPCIIYQLISIFYNRYFNEILQEYFTAEKIKINESMLLMYVADDDGVGRGKNVARDLGLVHEYESASKNITIHTQFTLRDCP